MKIEVLKELAPVYFSRLFPFDDFYKWLSYGEEDTFTCREFAFNFDGERYLRNQTFSNAKNLKTMIKQNKPIKIDIGAIFNMPPSYKHSKIFQMKLKDNEDYRPCFPVQKELVFDFDLTDYDDVRSCCSGANICIKCWKYMAVAAKIIDQALREDFGFKLILWTFSGRRGIHCWICDKRARFLRKSARFGVAAYLQMVNGGVYMKKKVHLGDKLHKSAERALNVIRPLFTKMCVEEQNILGTNDNITQFLGIIDEDEMRDEVRELLERHTSSCDRWKVFVDYFKNQLKIGNEKWSKTPLLIEEIMLQYMYPRLDINVSIGINHLLKSPFCIHPKSGKIGVPFDPQNIDEFDPNNVPSIEKLLDEIDTFDLNMQKKGVSFNEIRKIADIQKTSLKTYHKVFQDFITLIENSNQPISDNNDGYRSDISMEFD